MTRGYVAAGRGSKRSVVRGLGSQVRNRLLRDKLEQNMESPLSRRVESVREDELLRAARHYRRAISALEGSTFEYLTDDTARGLREHLIRELRTVTDELMRRNVSVEQPAPDSLHAVVAA